MSSLYDKYHSEHNRTYMYNLIKNIINKDYPVDVSQNDTYNHFFESNFINTFKTVNTEDIKDLNNHLLTTQMDYFQNFIAKQESLTKKEVSSETDYIIYSLHRNINLQNSSRFNYRIKTPTKQTISIEKVIIPIEETPLFMYPTILISLDTVSVELHLRGTMNLRGREYGIYTPYYESSFTLNSDVCRIQFKNQLFNVRKTSDVYKILSHKGKKINLSSNVKEFKEGDYIRLCNFKNIEIEDERCLKEQYKIVSVRENEDCCELKVNQIIPNCEGLFVMNMSLQNSIHFTSPE